MVWGRSRTFRSLNYGQIGRHTGEQWSEHSKRKCDANARVELATRILGVAWRSRFPFAPFLLTLSNFSLSKLSVLDR